MKLFSTVLLIMSSSCLFATNLKINPNKSISFFPQDESQDCLSSPEDGLWSIAIDWQNSWPANWYHANPNKVENINGWTILHGVIKTEQGDFLIRDSYLPQDDRIKCIRRWTWTGEDTLKKCTLSIRFNTPGHGKRLFLPGIMYYGNPSGEKSGFTPIYHGEPGEESLYEEHRYPMPFSSFEWQENSKRYTAALHSLPSMTPHSNLSDQWWSLGAIPVEDGTELVLFSGPCASNRKHSVVKARQRQDIFADYDNAWLNIPPGAVIEKQFYLQIYPIVDEGTGFQNAVRTSLDIFSPTAVEDMPTFSEILAGKLAYAETRWLEKDAYAGYNKFDVNHQGREFIVFGWCGQAATPGYAYQLFPQTQSEKYRNRIQRSLDFLSTTEFYDQGFHTWYDVKNESWGRRIWKENPELLSQGQGMLNVAKAIELGRQHNFDTSKWEAFLKNACDFHTDRILADDWNPVSTNEAFFIAPFCKAAQLFQNEKYKNAAIKASHVYESRHLNMQESYWGGTLDASCEDKEGAFAALQGFLALYDLIQNDKYLLWAEHALDVVLSYVVVWDIDMPPGRLRDHTFKTRGWTAVSVQNMHIDVYGVLIAPYVYKIGKIRNDELLKQTAILMYRSCGQLMDPYGSQGEQPQQTNYSQGRADQKFSTYRGDYVEDWTVFWITAHFLNAAADFKLMGVELK